MVSRPLIVILFVFSVSGINLLSQDGLSIHFGLLMPVMDYSVHDRADPDRGGTTMGIGMGLQYLYPLTEDGLNLYGSANVLYNGYQKPVKEEVEAYYFELLADASDNYPFTSKFSNKFPRIFNIPVSCGLNYTRITGSKVSFFGNAGPVVNFYKYTDFVVVATAVNFNYRNYTLKTSLGKALGFKIGCGILVNEKTFLALDFLGLGKYDLDMSFTGGGYSKKFNHRNAVRMITFSVGFLL